MNNKQLYKISKFAYTEAFTQSQLDIAGSQQSKILEKMEKNRKYMKMQSITMKIVVGVFIALMVIIPIQAFISIRSAIAENIIPESYLIFAGSMTLSASFLIQIMYLIMFGMFFASSLLSGDYLKWLSTLPIEMKDMRKITMMTFFRGMDVQFVALLLVLPIGTAIITQSIVLTLLSLLLSIINIVFSFSLLVIIGEKINRIMNNNEANSKKATFARMFVMLSYLIGSMSMSLGLNFAMRFIPTLFTEATLSSIPSSTINTLNLIFSAIPLPFTASYSLVEVLIVLTGNGEISTTLIITSLLGLLLFIGFTYILLNKALKLLTNVFVQKSKSFDENAKKTTIEDVKLCIEEPVKAFFLKDRQMITRDMQMMMLVIMPILLPFIGIATTGFVGEQGNEALFVLFTVNIIYSVLSGVMIVWGLLNVESTGSTIHASLPITVRDQVNAKVRWIFLVLTISSFLPAIFMIGKEYFIDYLIITTLFFPIGPITGIITLELKVRLFGKMKYKYVIEDVNIGQTLLKWILIGVVALLVYIGTFAMVIIYMSEMTEGYIGRMATIILPIEATVSALLYFIYNKMFPKPKIF
ncbi:hypothetical protein [Candidatus Lokiarchaeum ossiferum]|uniref:hypothetical protein n=1 Tax=Candidatus Lokiarchaeum ossiferum TaxID=2951803 RepID=UPI00352CDE78